MSCPYIPRRTLLLGIVATAPSSALAQPAWLQKGLESLDSLDGGDRRLSQARIGKGLKEALRIASKQVVARVGQAGGYLNDPAIHIPLPGYLAQARDILGMAGAAGLLSDLETQINRAAETAAPKARQLFFDAIGTMTLADARKILQGPDDAATQYFKRTMSPELRETFRPIMDRRLAETGALRTLDRTLARYSKVPFAPELGQNAQRRLVDHGLDGALAGLFHYMAKEEAAIRNDPARRTSELLKDVFG